MGRGTVQRNAAGAVEGGVRPILGPFQGPGSVAEVRLTIEVAPVGSRQYTLETAIVEHLRTHAGYEVVQQFDEVAEQAGPDATGMERLIQSPLRCRCRRWGALCSAGGSEHQAQLCQEHARAKGDRRRKWRQDHGESLLFNHPEGGRTAIDTRLQNFAVAATPNTAALYKYGRPASTV